MADPPSVRREREWFDSFNIANYHRRRRPVSDELYEDDDDLIEDDYEYEDEDDVSAEGEDDDDYEVEEISSDEVDSVVANLNSLNSAVDSENIRTVIESAIDEILRLVYTEDELVSDEEDVDDGDDYLEEAA